MPIFLIFSLFKQLGGLNSLLQIETSPAIPLVSKVPTIILGMDVSHGSPGHSDIPSVAAVSIFLSFSVINNK
jgi:eukaryotic translation initiation factor 2C